MVNLLPAGVTVDRAMTVRQSWAFAIAAGFKPVENRGAMCNYLGTVALHSSRTFDGHGRLPTGAAAVAFEQAGAFNGLWLPDSLSATNRDPRLALGALIAVVDIVGCHRAAVVDDRGGVCCAPWGQATHRGPSGRIRKAVHIELDNPRVLARPIPQGGQPLLLWRLPTNVSELLATADRYQPALRKA
jgi:hypothetical protein